MALNLGRHAIYIGADKCGSSTLAAVFEQHPQVSLAESKDSYYFDRNYSRGFDWYAKQFHCGSMGAANLSLEICHDYMFSELALMRIARDIPQVKLVVFLRDPVERAWSAYRYWQKFAIRSTSFWEAVDRLPTIVTNGYYHRWLDLVFDWFDETEVHVAFAEDLFKEQQETLIRLFRFLEIADAATGADEVRNAASEPRLRAVNWAVRRGAQVARRHGLARVVGRVKGSEPVQWVISKPTSVASDDVVNPQREQVKHELAALYRKVPGALEERFGIEVPASWWR